MVAVLVWGVLAPLLPGGVAIPSPGPSPEPIVNGTDAASCDFPATLAIVNGGGTAFCTGSTTGIDVPDATTSSGGGGEDGQTSSGAGQGGGGEDGCGCRWGSGGSAPWWLLSMVAGRSSVGAPSTCCMRGHVGQTALPRARRRGNALVDNPISGEYAHDMPADRCLHLDATPSSAHSEADRRRWTVRLWLAVGVVLAMLAASAGWASPAPDRPADSGVRAASTQTPCAAGNGDRDLPRGHEPAGELETDGETEDDGQACSAEAMRALGLGASLVRPRRVLWLASGPDRLTVSTGLSRGPPSAIA